MEGERGQGIHDAEEHEDDLGEDDEAEDVARDSARETGGERVDDVLAEDAPATVAEGLVQADELALLLHHARDRREADEHGDQEEDRGEHRSEGLDGRGVRLHARVAREARAVLHVPHGIAYGRDLAARVGDLLEGVGAILLVLGAAVVELRLGVGERDGVGVELVAGARDLRERRGALVGESRRALVERGAGLGELLASRRYLVEARDDRRARGLEFLALVGDLRERVLLCGVELGVAVRELCLALHH